jgi:hypothetical protein
MKRKHSSKTNRAKHPRPKRWVRKIKQSSTVKLGKILNAVLRELEKRGLRLHAYADDYEYVDNKKKVAKRKTLSGPFNPDEVLDYLEARVTARKTQKGKACMRSIAAPAKPVRRKMRPGQRVRFAKVHSSIYDSSLMDEPESVRLFFLLLLPKADWHGFVTGTEESLSRLFNMPLDSVREAIRVHSGPDPRSRTADNDGRRIEKVQGGWRILNFELYRDGDAFAGPSNENNGTGSHTETETNTETEQRVRLKRERTYVDQDQDQDRGVPLIGGSEDWSPAEIEKYGSLTVDTHRKAFYIIRGWATRAAASGDWDFGVSQSYLLKELGLKDEKSIYDILKKFVALGVIEKTADHDYRNKKSARYRWVVESTIVITATEPEEDPI